MNTMGRAGAERALIELMRILNPEDYRISLYVLIPRGELFAEVPEHVRILNRKTDSRSVLSAGGKLFIAQRLLKSSVRGGSLKKAASRIWDRANDGKGGNSSGRQAEGQRTEKIMRRLLADGTPALPGKFDLAVAYLEGPATWYVAEKIKADRKAAFLHIDYSRAGYTKDLDGGCYDSFDRIFAVSEDVKNNFLKVYPEYGDRTALFFNIINRDHIRKRALESGGFADTYGGIRILTVGRLYYQKGYDIAVKTAEILKKNGYDFRWYVLGEGEEKKNLLRQIREAGLEDDFCLLGAVANPYPYFRQADLYVCSSRFEGKSIVIEEAQTLGLPVVATDCTGIEEQVEQGKDGIITGTEPEELACGIETLIADSALRAKMGKAAYERKVFRQGLDEFLKLLEERA